MVTSTSFHVAGVALGDIHHRFMWQAWHLDHLVTSTQRLPSFHVAGVALRALGSIWWRAWDAISRRRRSTLRGLWHCGAARLFAWHVLHLVTLRGRRGTW